MNSPQGSGAPGVMAEDSAAGSQPPAEPSGDDSQGGDNAETVEIPLSACAGMTPKPGDVLPMSVISVDQNNGVVNTVYKKPQMQAGPPRPKGSDGLADDMANNPNPPNPN